MEDYLFLLISILMASTGQCFLKKGVLKLGHLDISFSNIFYLILQVFRNWWLVTGVIFFGISLLSYLFALARLQLNIAYPVAVSCGIILISLASKFLFRESINRAQISGIIIIIFGIFLLVTK